MAASATTISQNVAGGVAANATERIIKFLMSRPMWQRHAFLVVVAVLFIAFFVTGEVVEEEEEVMADIDQGIATTRD